MGKIVDGGGSNILMGKIVDDDLQFRGKIHNVINDHHIALLISKKTLFEFLNKKFYYIQGYVL